MIDKVSVPQTNVNDPEVIVAHIYHTDGTKVKKGGEIIDIETTKALFTIESPKDGYFYSLVQHQESIAVGKTCAIISEKTLTKNEISEALYNDREKNKFMGKHITKRAQCLIEEKGLSTQDFNDFESITYASVISVLKERSNLSKNNLEIKFINEDEINSNSLLITGDPNLAIILSDSLISKDIIYIILNELSINKEQIKDFDSNSIKIRKVNREIAKPVHFTILNPRSSELEYKSLKENIQKYFLKVSFEAIISDSAFVSTSAKLEHSVFVAPNVYIGPFVSIGEGSIILPGCNIAHHTSIGLLCSISDGASIGGNVIIGNRCLIGLNSAINRRVKVSSDKIVPSCKCLIEDLN